LVSIECWTPKRGYAGWRGKKISTNCNYKVCLKEKGPKKLMLNAVKRQSLFYRSLCMDELSLIFINLYSNDLISNMRLLNTPFLCLVLLGWYVNINGA
jgi:hypothetical protein